MDRFRSRLFMLWSTSVLRYELYLGHIEIIIPMLLSTEPGRVLLVTCYLILELQTCHWLDIFSKNGRLCH